MTHLLGDTPTFPEVWVQQGTKDWKVATMTPKMLPRRQPGSPRLINDTSVLCK